MTSKQEHESKLNIPSENGADVDSMQSRVADLLDNVTVEHDETVATPAPDFAGTTAGGNGAGEEADSQHTTQSRPTAGDGGASQPDDDPARARRSNGVQDIGAAPETTDHSDENETPVQLETHRGDQTFIDLPDLPELPLDPAEDGPQFTLLNAVKIKGRAGGVAVEIGEGEWDALMQALDHRLHAAEGFFRGGRVVLDVGNRPLIEADLRQIQAVLEEHEMVLSVVRSTVERTLRSALEVGLITSSDDPPPPPIEEHRPRVHTSAPKAVYFVYRGHLRSGQVLRKSENIVVIGDINPGAQVISSGDIMIWGRLRGVAHAGAGGNKRAVIAALEFAPSQLRIAHLTMDSQRPSKVRRRFWFWQQAPDRRAEIAYIADGKVILEPWNESGSNNPLTTRR